VPSWPPPARPARHAGTQKDSGAPAPVTLWEGEFITDTWEYSNEEREERQYAPLRAECERIGIAWPKAAAPPRAERRLKAAAGR
jgi:hypothetical protein